MTDALPFLRAIREAPDDDALRLIYADWLEEHGEAEQAEFIRVQIKLAELAEHEYRAGEPEYATEQSLRHRERELLDEFSGKWLAEFFCPLSTPQHPMSFVAAGSVVEKAQRDAGLHGQPFQIAEFRRGMIKSLTLSARNWIAHGDAIRERHPVREVRLTTFPDYLPHFEYGELCRVVLIAENGAKVSEWVYSSRQGHYCHQPIIEGMAPIDFYRSAFRGRWPGVTFHLPQRVPTRAQWYDEQTPMQIETRLLITHTA